MATLGEDLNFWTPLGPALKPRALPWCGWQGGAWRGGTVHVFCAALGCAAPLIAPGEPTCQHSSAGARKATPSTQGVGSPPRSH